MIKFALRCARGHEFESWFQNGEVFDSQTKAGLIACPRCQATEVSKAIMAPAVSGRSGLEFPEAGPKATKKAPLALLDRRDLEMRAMMNALRKRVLETAEDVGARFADEARKVHDGIVPERPIHGHAKFEEARALIEDGVPILPLPPALDEYN